MGHRRCGRSGECTQRPRRLFPGIPWMVQGPRPAPGLRLWCALQGENDERHDDPGARVGPAHPALPLAAGRLGGGPGADRPDRRQLDGVAFPPGPVHRRAAAVPAGLGRGGRALVALCQLRARPGHRAALPARPDRPGRAPGRGPQPAGRAQRAGPAGRPVGAGADRPGGRRRDRQRRPAQPPGQRRPGLAGDRLAHRAGQAAADRAGGAAHRRDRLLPAPQAGQPGAADAARRQAAAHRHPRQPRRLGPAPAGAGPVRGLPGRDGLGAVAGRGGPALVLTHATAGRQPLDWRSRHFALPAMDTPPRIELLPPDTPEALAATREIFREYAGTLGVDLCFQNFDAELAALPGDYAEPAGGLLLAWVDGQLAGCGAFRQLAHALMDQAVQAGYSAMLLDTLDDMEAARELYASLGFAEVPPYYFNPSPGAHYLKAELG